MREKHKYNGKGNTRAIAKGTLAICLMACLLFTDIPIIDIPVKTHTANAAGTTHVHDASCYEGTLHAAHGSECYVEETVTKNCNGTWKYNGNVSADVCDYEKAFKCTSKSCTNYDEGDWATLSYAYLFDRVVIGGTTYDFYWDGNPTVDGSVIPPQTIMCTGSRYHSLTTKTYYNVIIYHYCANSRCSNYYKGDVIKNYQYCHSEYSWYTVPTDERGTCDSCGQRLYTRAITEYHNEWLTRVKCSACGDITYDYATNYVPYHQGRVHGSYTTKENRLVCTKEVGCYYDNSGNKCAPVCGKTVKAITAVEPEQVVRLGEMPNANVVLSLYNGQIVSDYTCDISGYNPNDLTGAWQEVTLTVKSADYPYRYDSATGNRVAGTASVKIRVKVLGKFNVNLDADSGGTISGEKDGGGNWLFDKSSVEYLVGSRVSVCAMPAAGYTVKLFKVNGVSGSGTLNLAADVGTEDEYINPTEEVVLENGKVIYNFTMQGNDVSISARFMPAKYVVTYNANGGHFSDNSTVKKSTVKYGQAYSKAAGVPNNPEKENCVFLGWFTHPSSGTEVSLSSAVDTSKLLLYAHYADKSSSVVYSEYDSIYEYPLPVNVSGFTYASDTFWHKEEVGKNGAGDALLRGSRVNSLDELFLYGKWNANKYKVTLDANGGTFAGSVANITDADGKVELASSSVAVKDVLYHAYFGELPVPAMGGAIFGGWYSDKLRGSVTANDIMTATEDLQLTAKWLTVAPDLSSFAINNIRVSTDGNHYNPSTGVPSTEDLIISGDISPWFVTWSFNTINGKNKISDLNVFYAADISFSAINSSGEEGFNDNHFDPGCSIATEIYSDRTVFRTDDGKVVITIYGDDNRADTIVVDGANVPLANTAAISSASRHFEATVAARADAANGTYRINYTISAEREEELEW